LRGGQPVKPGKGFRIPTLAGNQHSVSVAHG
jgi:hypothetical protein